MDERLEQLTERFEYFVRAFDNAHRFTRPSIYFHERTLERLRADRGE
jgi:hypothetical protein